MDIISDSVLKHLKKSHPDSHKGQNGRLLVMAGSKKFHGALVLACQVASRLVDIVYVFSTAANKIIIQKMKQEQATFITIESDELWSTVELVDAVLMGPGLPETKETLKIVHKLLKKIDYKKTILDASVLYNLNPLWLHNNCAVTPHADEFKELFKREPTPENVEKMARYYQCIVALKGKIDYVSNGKITVENRTGNVGMTKGGTGDVLAGLVAGLACANDLWSSVCAGIYLNGLAGDHLYEKFGTFYNAEDVVGELGRIWKSNIS